jgi:MFS family permease
MLVGGALADRFDRRRILLVSQGLQMTLAGSLFVLYLTDRLSIGLILGLAFLTGLCQSQSAPTYQAVITTIVPKRLIPNAVALNSLQFNLSRAAGPSFAALLLARGGTGACFFANTVSFVAVILALWRTPKLPPIGSPGGLARSVFDGVRHVWGSPTLRVLTLLGAAASLLAFPLLTYLPVVATTLSAGAVGYSILLTGFGAGAIGGALLTAHRGSAPGRGRSAVIGLSVYAGFSCAAVNVPSHPLAVGLLFGAGLALVSALSMLNSLVQEAVPDALRGRVLALYGLAFRGGGPFGSLVAGFLIGAWGSGPVLGAMSLMLGLAAFAAGRTSQALREA